MPVTVWVIVSICGLVPPFSRDALNDHMMLPLLWERHGLFWRDMALSFTAYPPLADIPYILFAGHSWDWAASLWHALGALVTMLFIHRSMQFLGVSEGPRRVVLLSWIMAPVVIALCTWSYVDLWLCAVAAAVAGKLLKQEWSRADAWCYGLLLGFGMLIKYNGMALALAGFLGLAWRWRESGAVMLPILARAVITACVVAGGWYIGNWVFLGHPFFPLGVSGSGLSWLQIRQQGYDEPFWWALLAPLRMFFWGEVNNARLFDGMLSPLWLLCFAAVWIWRRDSRMTAVAIMALIYMIFALSISMRARYWLPGLAVMLPLLGLLLMRMRGQLWCVVVAAAFLPPVLAGIVYLRGLAPWQYWFEGRQAFLQKHVVDYGITDWASGQLPHDARVYLLWTGGRAYYLDREYSLDFGREGNQLKKAILQHASFPYDYVLMRRDLADRTLGVDIPVRWGSWMEATCMVVKQGAFELRRLQPCG